jgi:hypothetical protein
MDFERAIEFILEQQARLVELQTEAEKRQAKAAARHDREIAQIREELRRGIRLAVEDARAERVRRQAVAREVKELRAAQKAMDEAVRATQKEVQATQKEAQATQAELRNFIKSLGRGSNGGPRKQ